MRTRTKCTTSARCSVYTPPRRSICLNELTITSQVLAHHASTTTITMISFLLAQIFQRLAGRIPPTPGEMGSSICEQLKRLCAFECVSLYSFVKRIFKGCWAQSPQQLTLSASCCTSHRLRLDGTPTTSIRPSWGVKPSFRKVRDIKQD